MKLVPVGHSSGLCRHLDRELECLSPLHSYRAEALQWPDLHPVRPTVCLSKDLERFFP
jgi:hypothetical protein